VASVRTFGLKREDFIAIVDGMEMDVPQDIRAPDFATLDLYCDRVASAVGRLSVKVFGLNERDGITLAHHLGRALQLTNILRDIDEDAAIGRLYLPRELLAKAAILTTDPDAAIADPRVDGACRDLAALALDHFAAADRVLRAKPRGRLLAPRLMSAVYRTILQQMLLEGWVAPRRRVRIGKARLLWLVARCSVFG
ncbi:MAG: presqualene diphosphate synthase, partial [Rhodospirillaceae bacterium]|nr:presqualene diphosphate synthase [Rhodospirillaceae bacterium]